MSAWHDSNLFQKIVSRGARGRYKSPRRCCFRNMLFPLWLIPFFLLLCSLVSSQPQNPTTTFDSTSPLLTYSPQPCATPCPGQSWCVQPVFSFRSRNHWLSTAGGDRISLDHPIIRPPFPIFRVRQWKWHLQVLSFCKKKKEPTDNLHRPRSFRSTRRLSRCDLGRGWWWTGIFQHLFPEQRPDSILESLSRRRGTPIGGNPGSAGCPSVGADRKDSGCQFKFTKQRRAAHGQY